MFINYNLPGTIDKVRLDQVIADEAANEVADAAHLAENAKQKTYVTPEEFGAVGDGVTDDTVALQAAINYASTNKYVCMLSNKSYVISSTLLVPENCHICGSGKFSTYLSNSSNNFAITLSGGNVHIENLKIAYGKGISFGSNAARKSSTLIRNIVMNNVDVAISMLCATGYNYFDNIEIHDNGVSDVIIIGDASSPSPYPNYIYFSNMSLEPIDHGHDYTNAFSGFNIYCGTYVYIDKCDIVGYRKGIYLSGGSRANDLTITKTSFYDCYNDFYTITGSVNYADIMFANCIFNKGSNEPVDSTIIYSNMSASSRIIRCYFTDCIAELSSTHAGLILTNYWADFKLDITCNMELYGCVTINNPTRCRYQDSYTEISGTIPAGGQLSFTVNSNKNNAMPIRNYGYSIKPNATYKLTNVAGYISTKTITFVGDVGYPIDGIVF